MKKHLIFCASAVVVGVMLITFSISGLIGVFAKPPIDWHDYKSICLNPPHVDTVKKFGSNIDKVSSYCACVYSKGSAVLGDEQFAMQYDMIRQINFIPSKFQKIVDICAEV